MQESFRDSAAIVWSLIGHVLVFVLISLNLSVMPEISQQPVRLAIEATVVPDQQDARRRQREEEVRRREAEAARQREAEERRKAEAEQQRVAEAERRQAEVAREKAAEQQREVERQAEQKKLEQERIALEKRQREAAEQQRKAEEQKREQERLAAEKRRQEEAELARKAEEQRRQEEEARRQARLEAEMQAQLAEEEQRQSAVQSGLLDQWVEVIRQRVQRNWNRPASAEAGLECEVRVSQIPGGEVVDVRLGQCNGDAAVVRSIENAVYRSSPLPPPSDPSLFERTLIFTFKPQE